MNENNLPVFEEQEDAYVQSEVTARPELPKHFYRTNSRGFVECIEADSGRILAVQASTYDLLESKFDRLIAITTPQGKVYMEKGLDPDLIPELQAIPYSKLLADLICEKVASEGMTLVKACVAINVPYATVRFWRRTVEEFRDALQEAKRDRSEVFHDEAIDTARTKVSGKDKIATLQWAAEKGNPQEYGAAKKGAEGGGTTIQIISINTGIKRPGDAGYEAVEANARAALGKPAEQIGQAEKITDVQADFEVMDVK
jgi:hypothetical protein